MTPEEKAALIRASARMDVAVDRMRILAERAKVFQEQTNVIVENLQKAFDVQFEIIARSMEEDDD